MQRGAQDYLIIDRTDADLLVRSVRYARDRVAWRRESRRQEAELLQAQKMEAIGRLAGGVAHDFNNVLAAIFGYCDLLLEQFTRNDPRRADVQEIRRSAERAAALTRQLLAFSRKQILQPRLVNLNDIVGGIQNLIAPLVGADVTVDIRGPRDLWSVRADPGQMEQVLMNLAANARDAMPEGGRLTIETANVEVRADPRTRPGLQSGAYVTMSVTDNGTGVAEDIRAHMFEPFFTTKDQGKGTGLGLATVYGIVKQSGGSVYVESEEGAGTRFVIYLPRVPGERL
jgi:signal transduction histidine kinase